VIQFRDSLQYGKTKPVVANGEAIVTTTKVEKRRGWQKGENVNDKKIPITNRLPAKHTCRVVRAKTNQTGYRFTIPLTSHASQNSQNVKQPQ